MLHFYKGITPAGAGKTRYARRCTDFAWDHPRRCGENAVLVAFPLSVIGSPPQVRGKPSYFSGLCAARRITPAGAGKTFRRRQSFRTNMDHPRRCGENQTHLPAAEMKQGSPPQVRGKRADSTGTLACVRITPAGAGKTSQTNRTVMLSWDHPRRCGENLRDWVARNAAAGSPPQVRGKPAG